MYNQQTNAIFDMLRIQELQDSLNDAIAHGNVISFDELVKERTNDPHTRRDEDISLIVYQPSKYEGFGVILANYFANGFHNEIIDTYNDLLDSVDVYLSWGIDTDGHGNAQYCFDGLFVVPKGGDPTREPSFYWSASAIWPDDVKPPAYKRSSK